MLDAVTYLKTKKRICERYQCSECPFEDNCDMIEESNPERATEIVEKWLEDHPVKTILSDFLKKYPNAKGYLNAEGYPSFCCSNLGFPSCCEDVKNCQECWNRLY